MGIQFFTNWELWEQLTFVLAAGIVAVFFIGWAKLWWMQRLLKKHALIDEEKRVRQTTLRKSGLRRVEIPFGVRAIQSGVEVEGIWISRPVTPTGARSSGRASSTTLDIDGDLRREEKGKAVLGSIIRPTATVTELEPTPKPSPRLGPTGGYFDQNIRQDIGRSSSPGPQMAYLQPYSSQRPTNDTSYTTRYPESAVARHHLEAYIPTASSSTVNSSPSPRVRPADRISISSEEGLSFSGPRYPADARSRPSGLSTYYSSALEDSESSSSAGPSRAQGKYCSRVRAETRGDPLEGAETDRAPSPDPHSAARPSLASTRPTPVRTYADQHENTSSRVVNSGFEVLRAGTFGHLSGDDRLINDNSTGLAR
ncbi:hypothetical protein O1611_g819 [Lasiodiplodia mahajangana]|uniref:Uncharacterized protein n=1 Tax=Lasiodiplodia mahajangana TaxID=1108764 RepID=A0ACC2K020_9PEZI|nr:hypothetical protein O1611_g819 [Lasiodiplodia mahajangana]